MGVFGALGCFLCSPTPRSLPLSWVRPRNKGGGKDCQMETEATCWGAPGQRTSGSQLWEPDHPQASRPARIRLPLGAGCWQCLCRVMGVPLPETGSPVFWHHPSRLECESIPCPAGPRESQKGAESGTLHSVTPPPQGKSLGVGGVDTEDWSPRQPWRPVRKVISVLPPS